MKLAEKITSIVVMSIITAASVVSVINMAANDNNKITLKNIANGESADILSENIAADFFFGTVLLRTAFPAFTSEIIPEAAGLCLLSISSFFSETT